VQRNTDLINSKSKQKAAGQSLHCVLFIRADLHLDLDAKGLVFLFSLCLSLLKLVLSVTRIQTHAEISVLFSHLPDVTGNRLLFMYRKYYEL